MNSPIHPSFGALVGAGATDTRIVLSIVTLLVVLGIGLVMVAVWAFKITRPDRELLAPLEVMGEKRWRESDPVWQRRRLDEVRPPDAEPLVLARTPPAPDETFDDGPAAPGFDDLQGEAPGELAGVMAALAQVNPDGDAVDTDPTPPSTEVPVVTPEMAPADAELYELVAAADDSLDQTVAADWSPPVHAGTEGSAAPVAEAADAGEPVLEHPEPELPLQEVLDLDSVAEPSADEHR